MNMQTSYFARMNGKSFKSRNLNGVSIARSSRYWDGRTYPPLFPTWEMIKLEDRIEYEIMYRRDVLDKLDPQKVWDDLGEDAILLCHESAANIEKGDFCHRHIVARWLEENLWPAQPVTELKDEKAELKKIVKSEQIKMW